MLQWNTLNSERKASGDAKEVEAGFRLVGLLRTKVEISLPVFLIAAVCGVVLEALFIREFLKAPKGAEALVLGSPILVAASPIPVGHSLSADDLEVKPFSQELFESSTFAAEKRADLIGKKTTSPLKKGDPFVSAMFYRNQTKRLLESIPLGRRLFTLPQTAETAMVHLSRGDLVDIVGHLQLPGKGFVTQPLIQAIPVAWSSQGGGDEDGDLGKGIAFYLTSEEIDFLLQSKKFGQFEVVLRNPADGGREEGQGMTESEFLNDERIRKVYEDDLFQIRR